MHKVLKSVLSHLLLIKLALRSKFLKSMFKGHSFPKVVILQAVYFKLRFLLTIGLSKSYSV